MCSRLQWLADLRHLRHPREDLCHLLAQAGLRCFGRRRGVVKVRVRFCEPVIHFEGGSKVTGKALLHLWIGAARQLPLQPHPDHRYGIPVVAG
jgi:hypothetical protein